MRCDPVSWHGNMDKGSDNNEIEKKKGLNGKIFEIEKKTEVDGQTFESEKKKDLMENVYILAPNLGGFILVDTQSLS